MGSQPWAVRPGTYDRAAHGAVSRERGGLR